MTGPTPKTALVPLRGTPDVGMHDGQRQRLYVAIGWDPGSAQLYVFAPRSEGALVFRKAA